jgi:hypothetical protein
VVPEPPLPPLFLWCVELPDDEEGGGDEETGAGSVNVGVGATGVVGTAEVLGDCATDTLGLAFRLCLGFGLGRGLSDAFSGENCDSSSRLTLWEAVVCVVTAATRVVLADTVAARAGASWLTARATRKAAPNAATMQMMAVPAKRTVK